jgi:tripartite-type tricarboxylate transporter receptor subunit TctC
MKRVAAFAGLISVAVLAGVGIGAVSSGAMAADYPDRPVRIQLGFAAGGGADILARWYADKLSKLSGGTFLIENKVGASGNLALDAAAKAKPDGLTLLLASTVTTAGNAAVFKSMPLDVAKDLVPIVGFAETPFVLVVAPDAGINSVADLTALIKSKNGKSTYGSATTSALASSALYLNAVKAEATYVGYKATATAVQDVTGKQIDFAFADVVYAVGQAKQGRIKLLAIASDERSPSLPDLPTLKETTGARTGDIVAHWGIWAPVGTPKDIIDKLEKWAAQITRADDTQKFLVDQGATSKISDAADYKRRFTVALKSWADAVKIGKIEIQ